MKRILNALSVIAAAGMFLVLVMGAAVTDTGSEHGCGRSWPLCHGQLIPQMAVQTMIEFSHRAVVGVESVLIIAVAVLALVLYWDRTEIKILAPIMVAFLFLQAGLGAWAVMAPQLSAVLALHFGVSLIAFASVLLTAIALLEMGGRERLRARPAPAGFRRYVWAVTAYSYVVVYLGAFVRHTNADTACSGWPLCNGAVLPSMSGRVLNAFAHRLGAALLVLAVIGLAVWAYRLRETRPDLAGGAALSLALVLAQALSGAALMWTHMDLFASLAHAGLIGLLFGSLTYLCMHVLPVPAERDARAAGSRPVARSEAVAAR